jgi:radical SAM-linked protein
MRLRYTKLGRVAFLGHLDLCRHLPRIFRRAGIELHYSVGYHPKPELSFGPALGLGIAALGELLDVKLGEEVPETEICRRLQAVTLGGIDWLGAAALGPNDRALGRVVAETELWAKLPAGTALEPALERWRGDAPLRVRRAGRGAGVGRMIDVRRAVTDLGPVESSSAQAVAVRRRLGWDGAEDLERPVMRFRLTATHEGSAKPAEVLEALWDAAVAADAELGRVALWAVEEDGRLMDPLDLAALRRPLSLPSSEPASLAPGARAAPSPS